MATIATPSTVQNATRIPYVTADEAQHLLQTELDRFMQLVATLTEDDWSRPTACTDWSVRDILAHQAGGYASGTGYREMLRQYSALPKRGQLPEDAINALQLRERADATPADLIAELERVGPSASQNWAYGFRLVKPLGIPHAVGGFLTLRHLMWVIHSRDTWMHRLDICRATRRPFEQTREHDGRIVALVVRDVAMRLRKSPGSRAVILLLAGEAGGEWQVGPGTAAATIEMDALDFNILASGRYSDDEGLAKAVISGDRALAERVLRNARALY